MTRTPPPANRGHRQFPRREGLTVLVHPNTRDPRRDHLVHALWMGQVLDIVDAQALPSDDEAELPLPVNTQPTVAP